MINPAIENSTGPLLSLRGFAGMSMVERFHASYIPEPNTGCWFWLGALSKGNSGYGQIMRETSRTYIKAHRYSWLLNFGRIPRGLCVLHKCDVSFCVNPEHLFLGTQADNIYDMVAKNRHYYGNASGHIGVRWREERSKWQAELYLNGRTKYLGYFDRLSDAIAARKAAQIEHSFHGNYGRAMQ